MLYRCCTALHRSDIPKTNRSVTVHCAPDHARCDVTWPSRASTEPVTDAHPAAATMERQRSVNAAPPLRTHRAVALALSATAASAPSEPATAAPQCRTPDGEQRCTARQHGSCVAARTRTQWRSKAPLAWPRCQMPSPSQWYKKMVVMNTDNIHSDIG